VAKPALGNFFFKKTLPTAVNLGTRQRGFFFLKKILCRVPQQSAEFFIFFKKSLPTAPI
jgi:hypothetical protein